jgi:hypothetical protein
VPGRVCLLGEHSDWAGGFKGRKDSPPDVREGYCLVCGTDQGLYARASRQGAGKVKVRSVDERGGVQETTMDLELASLRATAQEGAFFSYVAGVAHEVLARYGGERCPALQSGGLEVDNYRTDLPLAKGLSSSAAVCVLVARAFSVVYGLALTTMEEMDLAYRGETLTPSQCGRMDQCCAFGRVPVFMTFDNGSAELNNSHAAAGADGAAAENGGGGGGGGVLAKRVKLPPGAELRLVIVDLLAKKDTTEILASLQKAYSPEAAAAERLYGDDWEDAVEAEKLLGPGAWKRYVEAKAKHKAAKAAGAEGGGGVGAGGGVGGDGDGDGDGDVVGDGNGDGPKACSPEEHAVYRGVRGFLGRANRRLVACARGAVERGDAWALGAAMKSFQVQFDEALRPACPQQLDAPVLHRVLAHPPLQPLVWGAKGVGSQGDGSAQFLCRSEADQQRVLEIVRSDFGMPAFPLTITGEASECEKEE